MLAGLPGNEPGADFVNEAERDGADAACDHSRWSSGRWGDRPSRAVALVDVCRWVSREDDAEGAGLMRAAGDQFGGCGAVPGKPGGPRPPAEGGVRSSLKTPRAFRALAFMLVPFPANHRAGHVDHLPGDGSAP